jgi:hypothetical protein
MPLIMHGSGDVSPSDVNTDSAKLLAELTLNYIANLVEAAVDAHEILNDGPPDPPPPPLPRSRTRLPAPYTETDSTKTEPRKRRRATDEYWDEPLLEPKIKNKPPPEPNVAVRTYEGVNVDEWVGVDFLDNISRVRKAHVTAPSAIGTQCFIFPICHDQGLYGKVLEVQAARRSIAPVLVDPIVMDVIRAEGALLREKALRKREKATTKNEEDMEEPEETDSEDDGGAAWPGLEYLLPVHITEDFKYYR